MAPQGVGIHVHARATRLEALEPIRQGSASASTASPRALPAVVSPAVIKELRIAIHVGSVPARICHSGHRHLPGFVRAPEDNHCAERLALLAFPGPYNATPVIERQGLSRRRQSAKSDFQPSSGQYRVHPVS